MAQPIEPADARPWRVYWSPKHRYRVVKHDLVALGQGRKAEEFLGLLPAGLSNHEAKLLAPRKWPRSPKPAAANGTAPPTGGPDRRPWIGYWHPTRGARCRRVAIPTGQLRDGEIETGHYASDMAEEDVLGLIRGKYAQPTYKQKARTR